MEALREQKRTASDAEARKARELAEARAEQEK